MTTAWSWLAFDGTDGKERLFSEVLKMLALIFSGWLITICQTSCLYTTHLIKQGRLGNGYTCNQCANVPNRIVTVVKIVNWNKNSKLKLTSLLLEVMTVHLSAAILFIWLGTKWPMRSESDPAEPLLNLLNPNNGVGRSRASYCIWSLPCPVALSLAPVPVEKVAESAELPRPS